LNRLHRSFTLPADEMIVLTNFANEYVIGESVRVERVD
jgi:hypothetical protein